MAYHHFSTNSQGFYYLPQQYSPWNNHLSQPPSIPPTQGYRQLYPPESHMQQTFHQQNNLFRQPGHSATPSFPYPPPQKSYSNETHLLPRPNPGAEVHPVFMKQKAKPDVIELISDSEPDVIEISDSEVMIMNVKKPPVQMAEPILQR